MKYWQAQVTRRNGATFIFGVQARNLPRALRKAYELAAQMPGIAEHITITRIPSPSRRRPV